MRSLRRSRCRLLAGLLLAGALAAACPTAAVPAVRTAVAPSAWPSAPAPFARLLARMPAGTRAAPGATVYAGNTAPSLSPMMIEVGKTRLARIAVQHNTACFSYASVLGPVPLRGSTLSRTGAFSFSVVTSVLDSPRIWWTGERQPDAVTETYKGTVGGTTARGTVRATVKFLDGSSCTTGDQRWSLTHAPGQVFGGVTSQSMPVSVELSSTHARIKHLHLGWVAPCPDGSLWVVPEFLTNFPMAAGTAVASFEQEYPRPEGGVTKFGYRLLARAGASKSTGTLNVSVSEVDAAGAVQTTCSTPTVRWTARS